MQIVIDISEEIIKDAKESPNYYPSYLFGTIWKSIGNGTLLPKGHGRLADLDAALKCVDDDSLEPCDAKWQAIMLFDWAMSKRVVLEADKEGDTDANS